jgi:hypothetical protein
MKGLQLLIRAWGRSPIEIPTRNSQAASKTGTGAHFNSQIAHNRERCLGRDEDIGFLDSAWASQDVNVVTIIAGPVSGSLRSSTVGFGGWRLNIIVLPSSFLAGLSTDREAVGALRPQMNFLMLL